MKQTEHSADWKAAAKVEIAREQVAPMIGATSDDIFFTSDATQAITSRFSGFVSLDVGKTKALRSVIEHKSVLSACQALSTEFGFEVADIPVDQHGRVILAAIDQSVNRQTALISVAMVNNEIGVIQDIAAINSREARCALH